jgi:hypothetical protein
MSFYNDLLNNPKIMSDKIPSMTTLIENYKQDEKFILAWENSKNNSPSLPPNLEATISGQDKDTIHKWAQEIYSKFLDNINLQREIIAGEKYFTALDPTIKQQVLNIITVSKDKFVADITGNIWKDPTNEEGGVDDINTNYALKQIVRFNDLDESTRAILYNFYWFKPTVFDVMRRDANGMLGRLRDLFMSKLYNHIMTTSSDFMYPLKRLPAKEIENFIRNSESPATLEKRKDYVYLSAAGIPPVTYRVQDTLPSNLLAVIQNLEKKQEATNKQLSEFKRIYITKSTVSPTVLANSTGKSKEANDKLMQSLRNSGIHIHITDQTGTGGGVGGTGPGTGGGGVGVAGGGVTSGSTTPSSGSIPTQCKSEFTNSIHPDIPCKVRFTELLKPSSSTTASASSTTGGSTHTIQYILAILRDQSIDPQSIVGIVKDTSQVPTIIAALNTLPTIVVEIKKDPNIFAAPPAAPRADRGSPRMQGDRRTRCRGHSSPTLPCWGSRRA